MLDNNSTVEEIDNEIDRLRELRIEAYKNLEKEHKNQIIELSKETNKLGREIYTRKEIAEILKITVSKVNAVMTEYKKSQEPQHDSNTGPLASNDTVTGETNGK
jgi:DNA-directed RNA polymerase specialized sigma subunit